MSNRWGGRRGSGSFRFFMERFWDRVNLSAHKTVIPKTDFVNNTKTIEDLDYTEMGGIWGMDSTVQFRKKGAVPAASFNVTYNQSGSYVTQSLPNGETLFYTAITSSDAIFNASTSLFRVSVTPGETIYFLTAGAGSSMGGHTGTTNWGRNDYGGSGSTAVGSFVVPSGVTELSIQQGQRGRLVQLSSSLAQYSSYPGGGLAGRTDLQGGTGGRNASTGGGYTAVWCGTGSAPDANSIVFIMGGAGGHGEYPGRSYLSVPDPITRRADGGPLPGDGFKALGGVAAGANGGGGTTSSGGASGDGAYAGANNQSAGSFLQGGIGESSRYDNGGSGGAGWYGGGGGGAGGGPSSTSGGGGSSYHNTFVTVENTWAPLSLDANGTNDPTGASRDTTQVSSAEQHMATNHFAFTIPAGARGVGGFGHYGAEPASNRSEHGFVMLWRKAQ